MNRRSVFSPTPAASQSSGGMEENDESIERHLPSHGNVISARNKASVPSVVEIAAAGFKVEILNKCVNTEPKEKLTKARLIRGVCQR